MRLGTPPPRYEQTYSANSAGRWFIDGDHSEFLDPKGAEVVVTLDAYMTATGEAPGAPVALGLGTCSTGKCTPHYDFEPVHQRSAFLSQLWNSPLAHVFAAVRHLPGVPKWVIAPRQEGLPFHHAASSSCRRRFFPDSLTEYIISSARWIISCTDSGGLRNVTAPMLKVTGQ